VPTIYNNPEAAPHNLSFAIHPFGLRFWSLYSKLHKFELPIAFLFDHAIGFSLNLSNLRFSSFLRHQKRASFRMPFSGAPDESESEPVSKSKPSEAGSIW